jgi:hypothetical protein
MVENYLFLKERLSDYLQESVDNAKAQINQLSDKEIEGPNLELQISQITSRNMLNVPVLSTGKDDISFDTEEIEVQKDPFQSIFPGTRKTTKYLFSVPFKGDAELFEYKPSTYSSSLPAATVVGKELVFDYTPQMGETVMQMKQRLEQEIYKVNSWLENVAGDVTRYNHSLRSEIDKVVEYRKNQIAKNKSIEDELGFKKRDK